MLDSSPPWNHDPARPDFLSSGHNFEMLFVIAFWKQHETIASPKTAKKYYQKWLKYGENAADFFLAKCFYRGRGVHKNPIHALRLFKKLADQGHTEAQAICGSLYKTGIIDHMFPNPQQAIHYSRLACDGGHKDAAYNLYIMLRSTDKSLARQFLALAAHRGHERAHRQHTTAQEEEREAKRRREAIRALVTGFR